MLALDAVSVAVAEGEFVAVMGPSGSGKSTFMNLLGCLDRPTAGAYRLEGLDVAALDGDSLAALRNRRIGYIFQSFNLLPRADALSNVELPMQYAGLSRSVRRARARALLETCGLGDRLNHAPAQLSGGQQQRVAIARALANGPSLLLADEPTGALDSRTGSGIMDLFDQLNQSGLTIVVVTHDDAVARRASRILRFSDGALRSDTAGDRRRELSMFRAAGGGR
ncbi:ABC transporter ATP-binding protein [Bradyrhizobium diazoefficiens]|nr:ABC transporter ATP-binding protein [Bradyrhizobium diazoefficiens]MBR0851610.1 ABC transporter ATP-binding protein [Bradyrhizobium diazoefficiens]